MACLEWLVPDLLLLGTQIPPLPPHNRRSNLSPINNSDISMQAQTRHTHHHSKQITPNQVSETNKHHTEHFQAFSITITNSMNKAKIYLLSKP
jgi:hypothetical protein